jgi:predicted Zn-dependent peptidase
MKATLTVLFSKWKKSKRGRKSCFKSDCHPRKQGITQIKKMLEKPLYIGAPGVSRNNPDYVAIEVVNLFGGRFTSMLNDELRVNSGLTYGASSRFNALNGGSFAISTFTAEKLPSQLSIKPWK